MLARKRRLTSTPSVGIFWGLPDAIGTALVTDVTPLTAAELYGAFLTHPRGHYEAWEGWRRLGATGLGRRGLPTAIARREYDEFPRGRIVFQWSERFFVIYADRKLQSPAMIARIVDAFGLTEQRTAVRSDAHTAPVPDENGRRRLDHLTVLAAHLRNAYLAAGVKQKSM